MSQPTFKNALKEYMPDVYEVITSEEWLKSSELLEVINERKLTDEYVMNKLGISESHLESLLFGEIKGKDEYDRVIKELKSIK